LKPEPLKPPEKCPICGTTPCKIPKSPEAKVEGMPTTYRHVVGSEVWVVCLASEVLAALTERDKEIERLNDELTGLDAAFQDLKHQTRCTDCGCATPEDADAKECGCESPVCTIAVPETLAQAYERVCLELSALQSTPGVERLREAFNAGLVSEVEFEDGEEHYGAIEESRKADVAFAAFIRALPEEV
jgi:hypothetical protein